MLNGWMVWISGCALAGLAPACVVDVGGDDVLSTGGIDMRWTVNNTTDPGACDYYAPSTAGIELELAIYDRGGAVATVYAPCEAFRLDRPLLVQASADGAGYYRGEVSMVDARDRTVPVSTTERLEQIWVVPRTNVELDVNFPPSSFLVPVVR